MKKVVIFCGSYGQINYALQLIQKHRLDSSFMVVISDYPDLFQFFQIINEKVFQNVLNLVYLEEYKKRRTRGKNKVTKLLGAFPDIICEKRYLKKLFTKHFANVSNNQIFFISPGYSGITFYMIKKLRFRNSLIYISPPPPYLEEYIPRNPKDLAKLIISKIIYGSGLAASKISASKGFPCVSERYIKNNTQLTINAEQEGLMEGFDLSKFRVFDTGNYDIVYFDDNLIGNGYINDSVIFKRELTAIFNIITKYFPENKIAYKYHPGYSGDETIINTGTKLPSFIPAELLYNEKTQLYLSTFSWSIAHIEKGLAVSIANLITLKDNSIKEKMTQILINESKSKILFPKSLDEFEQIISNLQIRTD
jgi:hypothetical protein